jgi:co-chaperonin GroES (HSP10)
MEAVKDKIIVSVLSSDEEEVLDSGIIMKASEEKFQIVGQVLSVGEEIFNIKAGDVIITGNNAGRVIKTDKKAFRVVTYGDVLAWERMS